MTIDSSFQTLTIDVEQPVVTVTVNRPDALNALSERVLGELTTFLRMLACDGLPGARGMILTGSGERAFIAGADIREMAAMSPDGGEAFGRLGQEVTELLEAVPVPVIAAVNGFALGGGCEMAMACDYIFATENAVFGQPEVTLGLIPGFGGCVRLQRYVGPGRAKELIYSGRKIDATEAKRIGLVNEVFSSRHDMLDAATRSLRDIAQRSPVAVASCKAAINAAKGLSVAAALDAERREFRHAFTTDDMREGTRAFLDKRPPTFTGT